MPTKPLTPKQAAFVDEYLKDLCGAKAAIRAGYAEKSAKKIAHELLRREDIAEAVRAAQAARSERTGDDADQVLRDIRRLGDKAERAGKWDAALKATELRGKHLGMFKDGGQATQPVIVNIQRF